MISRTTTLTYNDCDCLSLQQRRRIREKFNIPGGSCGDCCSYVWCPCCSICRDYREINYRRLAMESDETMMVAPAPAGMTLYPVTSTTVTTTSHS
mmetsp:Transcript_42638/g.69137  ORF Transcript_42638/g.69137 Transcript_42638/m.69137 type:complete len:95 (-) Transcript_42638:553-837(-)